MTRMVAMALLALTLLGACGGDDAGEPDRGPAASIDRDADGPISGPVNQARDAADQAEERQRQFDQAGD
jgi:hypothetical protein